MKSKIVGVLVIAFNLIWIGINLRHLYLNNNSDLQWFYIVPNWLLIFSLVFGFWGVLIGLRIYQGKIQVLKGLIQNACLIVLIQAVEFVMNM